MRTGNSMAHALQQRFQTIPRNVAHFCEDSALEAFLTTCRNVSAFSTQEDARSCDSALSFAFADGSRLDVGNPKQRVYPAFAKEVQ